MGCSTRRTKDFIRILQMVKKIINFIKASINDRMPPPLRSPTVLRPLPSLAHHFRVNLVGCCVQSTIGGRLKPRRILLYSFFARNPMAEKMQRQPPLLSSPCAPPLPNISQRCCQLLVGCCIPPPSRSHRNSSPRCSLYFYFFVAQFTAQTNEQTSSSRVPPGRISSQNPPLTANTIVRLIVASTQRAAATQHRCSAHLSIIQWAPFRRPKQGDQTQRARARTPGA
jgi:hypothetical protein